MFTEILRIKPKLSEADARTMENRLSSRFGRIAKRFGSGLKAAMKGTLVGLSLGLLAKLLDPLKEMEDRIKALLKLGEDTSEQADRFGTTSGKLRRLQDVSKIIGVDPDRLSELMNKYAEAIEKGRAELLDPDPEKEKSASTKVLGNFLNDKDIAQSFYEFLNSLKNADPATRRTAEMEVLGGGQTGAARKLIEADFAKEFARLGGPDSDKLGSALDKLAALEDRRRLAETKLEQQNIVQTSGKVNNGIVDKFSAAAKRDQVQELKDLSNIERLQKAQEGIDELAKLLTWILDFARMGVGYLGDLVKFLKESKALKSAMKWFGDK